MNHPIIAYGSNSHPKFRVQITFESPSGKLIGHCVQSGSLDYARGDWETFHRLPEALRREILAELREALIEDEF